MNHRIAHFILGLVGATVCIASAVLVSIFAQQAAYVVDPIMVSLAVNFLGLCAGALGFRIGAAAALEKIQRPEGNATEKKPGRENGERPNEERSVENFVQIEHFYGPLFSKKKNHKGKNTDISQYKQGLGENRSH